MCSVFDISIQYHYRFGENENGTTQRLPIDALGDRDLVNRLGQYPQDKQPFWLLNWQALEEHRKRQQTYSIRPSIFASPIIPQNTADQNNQGSVLSDRNGQNSQQNSRPSDQNSQQNPRPNDQISQNLQQNLRPNNSNDQNAQPNLRSNEQNGQSSGQNVKPSEPIAKNSQQNPGTNPSSNQNQRIQVNPTPPQVLQASSTMAAN